MSSDCSARRSRGGSGNVTALLTEPQREAWPRIKSGENVLIHSPTGSGKTLAAFLSALDGLYSDVALSKRKGIRTLYISPLKALGYDVERNLEEPMRGIEDGGEITRR